MPEPLHTTRFPGESDEYRDARDRLLRAEIELRRAEEAVAAERRRLPLGGEVTAEYVFESTAGPVTLAELFGDGRDTLFLYSFMFIREGDDPLGSPCPSCTSIIDAVDGEAQHLEQRIAVAAAAKVPLNRFRDHGDRRGWQHIELLSSAGSTYNADYHAEAPDGSQLPIATVFVRRDGRIHHSWSSELFFAPTDAGQHPRHVDFMWPLWKILDLTPEGRGTDWNPQLAYS